MTAAGLLVAAALAGAAGLGVEALLLESAGLALGYGRAGALGLAAFVAGWSLGAFVGARLGRPRAGLLLAGALVLAIAALALQLLLGGAGPVVGTAALVLTAVPQGALFPQLVQARERVVGARGSIDLLWVASLLGALLGAYFFAERLVASHGRHVAVLAAGCTALCAGALGAWLASGDARGVQPTTPAVAPGARVGTRTAAVAAIAMGAMTAWVVGIEWIALRLGVLWLGGMQEALTALLAASLLSLAVGAALLPALLPHGRAGVAWLLGLASFAAAWLVCAAPALRAVEERSPFVLALVLVGPALLPFGAAVPVIFRAASAGRSGEGERLGGLLVHEAWGAVIGGPLVHWALVPWLGLSGALASLSLLGVVVAVGLGRQGVLPGAVAVLLGAGILLAPDPARSAPPLANPAFTFLAFEEDADFAVSVIDDGLLGERTLLTDGFRAAGDGRDYRYMRALGHLPVLLHPAPARVCVLALGTGTTVGAVSLHPEVRSIEVLELSPAVVRQAHHFADVNHGALDDPRVEVVVGDGRHTLAARPAAFDVITLEPLLPDSPFAVYLYTREFYAAARAALAPGGLVCQWVPPHALEPATFDAVVDAFCSSFPHATLWLFDTQLALVGGEAVPGPLPVRFPPRPNAREINARASVDPVLMLELHDLGLGTAAGLAAHYVGDGADFPPVKRALTDADPWIIRSPRRSGAVLLTDLPHNLRALGAVESPPPWAELGDEALERWRGLRALARARAAHAWQEAEARGARFTGLLRPELERELGAAQEALDRDDPALLHFVSELRFLRALRLGVSRLAAGDAGSALEPLTTAVELRPERGDVHLYLAAGLQAAGAEDAAVKPWEAARERCPRILETPAGLRVLGLGFRAP